MISRIKRVQKFRIFESWTPHPGANPFRAINLIYGMNGSGKTTLADLMSEFASGSNAAGLSLEVTNQQGVVRTVTDPKDPVVQTLHVFNKDYVSRNLRFDEPDNQVEPLLVLGERAVEAVEKIEDAERALAAIQERLPAVTAAHSEARKQASAIAKACAQAINADTAHLGGEYDARSYTAARVKAVMPEASSREPMTDEALTGDLSFVKSPTLEKVAVPPEEQFSLASLQQEVEEVLARIPTAQPLPGLADNPSHGSWVQQGISFHEERDRCLFCTGPLSDERRTELARHFDESLTKLQDDVRELISRANAVVASAAAARKLVPASQLLHGQLKATFAVALAKTDAELNVLADNAREITNALERKLSSLFSPVTADLAYGQATLAPVRSLCSKHNATCDTFITEVLAAAKRIEHERVRAVTDAYERAVAEEESSAREAERLAEQRLELEQRILGLRDTDLDPLPLASELNDDLARLLGRNDLTVARGTTGFSVCRRGEPAQHLSEGERTALSLLYFLKSLETHTVHLEDAVVFIDDPVSSLDSNVITGVSAHIWARLVAEKQCQQVFLLTHSFELFRLWGNMLDRAPKNKVHDYATFEIRIKTLNTGGEAARTPIFLEWPNEKKMRSRLRSEYHYLFWRAASTLIECKENPNIENELDAAAILPNVCRRLLEGFLAFRYPAFVGDLRSGMDQATQGIGDKPTRTRLVTYLNTFSHHEETYSGRHVASPETLTILSAVFELIQLKDPDHFTAMCQALTLNAGTLSALPPT